MHEYWLQFFTAALGVYGKGKAAEKAADEACAIYDKRVALAEKKKVDADAASQKSIDEQVFEVLPPSESTSGVTVGEIGELIDGDIDTCTISASIDRLIVAKRVIRYVSCDRPTEFYRKAV